VVANPPFSTKAWTNGFDPANDQYGRFALGVPPPKNGDYAFLLHILASLKSTGKAPSSCRTACCSAAVPRRASAARSSERGYIKGIIGLPANLFYGTGIPACILVLDKEGAAGRKGIFMIDASKGFIKDGPKNRLRAQDIHKIVDAFTRQLELPRYSRMVPLARSRPEERLQPEPAALHRHERARGHPGHRRPPARRHPRPRPRRARAPTGRSSPACARRCSRRPDRPGLRRELKVAATDIKSTIFGHAEFTAWSTQTKKLFAKWRAETTPRLHAIKKGDKPKALIDVARRGAAGDVPEGQAHRRLRRLPAPHGLLGRDHAGRRLPHRQRRLARGRQAEADGRDKTRSPRTNPTSPSASRSGRPS
jgi:type I restriction enzyme M protein